MPIDVRVHTGAQRKYQESKRDSENFQEPPKSFEDLKRIPTFSGGSKESQRNLKRV